ncbi:MAG TPA: hypothetical protein GX517_12375 [Alicyclobacillus sp.]|nr:hypothetical protein [Alicyclobacillus sp.]
MAWRSFHFKMNDTDPLDRQIVDWLVRNPKRSESVREALRVYFFLKEHGIPVAPVQPELAAQTEAEPHTPSDDPAASEFFQAMKAGLEDWI